MFLGCAAEPAVCLHLRRRPSRGHQRRLGPQRQSQEEDQLLQRARGAPASHLRDGPLPWHQPPREPVPGHGPARVTYPGRDPVQAPSPGLPGI